MGSHGDLDPEQSQEEVKVDFSSDCQHKDVKQDMEDVACDYELLASVNISETQPHDRPNHEPDKVKSPL